MDHFGLLSTRLLSTYFDDRTFGAAPVHQPPRGGSYQSHPLSPEQLCRRAAQTPTLHWSIPEATQELSPVWNEVLALSSFPCCSAQGYPKPRCAQPVEKHNSLSVHMTHGCHHKPCSVCPRCEPCLCFSSHISAVSPLLCPASTDVAEAGQQALSCGGIPVWPRTRGASLECSSEPLSLLPSPPLCCFLLLLPSPSPPDRPRCPRLPPSPSLLTVIQNPKEFKTNC